MKNSSKKAISVVAVLLTLCSVSALALTGCNSNSANPASSVNSSSSTSSKQESSEETSNKEEINMKNYTINLKGNATTGYTWNYSVDKEEIIKEEVNKYTPDKAEEGMVGTGGTQTYSFKGVKEGNVTVTFKYAKSWEDNSTIETKTVKLHVDANGNISKVQDKTYTINLDANATTGYTWTYTVNKEGIVKETANEYTPNKTEGDVAGTGGVQTYSFEGVKKGNVILIFKYMKADSDEIAQTKKITLYVDDNGNITEMRKIDGNQYEVALTTLSEANWVYSVDNEGVVEKVLDEYIPNGAGSKGLSGMHTFVFKGVSEGDVTITFKSSHKTSSDDQITSSSQNIVVKLHADANGNITEQLNKSE
ncbi:MAG: protease inhibitor I42 family protein [Acutalibacteraceae bacterium]